MKKTKLIIGAHGHSPFGSSEAELEREYQTHYKPFIASLYRFPAVPVVLHYSGVLLTWIEQKHPEYFLILEELINRKQVEILGGGFYEPMLPLLPLADRLGQIELLTTYLRKHFGKRPRGCWLPGLIWEQPLASALQTCGMDYTFLSSTQFKQAGLSGPDIERPCLTEDQGRILTVFPISSELTDALLSRDMQAFARIASDVPDSGADRVLSVFIEGLFNGAGTESAFCGLLEYLSAQDCPFDLSVPSRVLKTTSAFSKSYFPSSADRPVMYWSMDEERRRLFDGLNGTPGASEDISALVAASLPRQFLVRYPEANGIYTKMLYTHILINQLRGDKYRKRAAREELWKAQGCDSFWHVGNGGLYRNRLRKAVYGALIEAEKITREKGVFIPSVISVDINLDGEKEFLLQGAELNGYVKLSGGSLFELDYLPKAWNYVDTMSRRREPYARGDLVLDELPRSAFSDRLLHPEVTLKDALAGNYPFSRNCAEERYEEIATDRVHKELTLRKAADFKGNYGGIEIQKHYSLRKNVLSVQYVLANRGEKPARFNFASEIDLSFAGEDAGSQLIKAFTSGAGEASALGCVEYRNVDSLRIEDVENSIPISLASSGPFTVWAYPVRTVCRIDGKIGEYYQSSCFVPVLPVILAPGESWETSFSLGFDA